MLLKNVRILLPLALLFSLQILAQEQWTSAHVFLNNNDRLEYLPDELGNIIPDFSHVGYRYGDEEIPDVDMKVEISPINGDDGQHIQNAINYVSGLPVGANGYRGAVLLKAGTWQVAGQIKIATSGVVLSGEGETESGTVILATGTFKRTLLEINGTGNLSEISNTSRNITESYVPVGRKFLVVENTDEYAVGDDFVIFRPGTEKWISDIKMDAIPPDPSGGAITQWTPSSYNLRYERVISAISGDTIFFRNPVVMAMEDQYGGGRIYKSQFTGRIENIGVENILFKSEYTSNTDENHAWTAVEFLSTIHSWVRNITAKHFGYAAVSIGSSSKHISVIGCTSLEPKSIVTGSRRYSFDNNGQLNLFTDCHASEGRHDYVLGSRVCGPNVFTNSTAVLASNDIGPHHRWATGALFDNISTNHSINVQDRSYMGSGHGWAGANMVFWNCKANTSVTQNPWASAKNYNIGFNGNKQAGSFPGRPDGIWEGLNKPELIPRSLYLAQLEDRRRESDNFYVLSGIDFINSETLRITFNNSVDKLTAENRLNYTISGTAGLTGNPVSVLVAFGNRVFLTLENMDFLQPHSSIIITLSENIKSADGQTLKGNKVLSLTFPDLRPAVVAPFQNINTETLQYAIAKVTKPATLYLMLAGSKINSKEDLENLIVEGKGVKANASTANEDIQVPVESLASGVYYFYAADHIGRVSDQSPNAVIITSTVGTNDIDPDSGIKIINRQIHFQENFPHSSTTYLQMIDITGRTIFFHKIRDKEYPIILPTIPGIHFIRIYNENTFFSRKVFIL